MYRTLGDFLAALDRRGELLRITEPVSPILEISEIADLHSKSPAASISQNARLVDPQHCDLGGKALLFESVEGSDFPLTINVFGSWKRMEMALGCAQTGGFEAIANRLASLTKPAPPRSLREIVGKARELLPLLRTPPKLKRAGICQEVVKLTQRGEVDLMRLPMIKCWPLDGDPRKVGYNVSPDQAGTAQGQGRYITFAGMHTIHADDAGADKPASHNIGMYRAQLIDATHLAMHWHMHHDGAAHWRSWKRAGKKMPIAICLGGESVLPYAATCPLPPGISELLMAGFLNGSGIPLVKAKTVPLRVPANSEIVIEGYVDTDCGFIDYDPDSGEPLGDGAVFEGPFGDHTGFYSLPDRYPIVEVTAITHRRDAVYPTTIVGPPPQEDYYLGKATERIFLPLLKTLIPDIEDYHLPMFGCFHNCAFIRIRKSYPLQARRVMHAVWGAGQMAWTKCIVIVDDDVNVHDEQAVLRAVAERCHFARDIEIVNGPLDILDHAAPRLGAGHKIGFDATRAIVGEEVNGVCVSENPDAVDRAAQARETLQALCNQSQFVSIDAPSFGLGRIVFAAIEKTAAGQGPQAIQWVWDHAENGIADAIIVVDADVDLRDWEAVLFRACANSDPGRDIVRNGARIGLDATKKVKGDERNGQPVRPFPPIIEMSEDIRARVDERRSAFGL